MRQKIPRALVAEIADFNREPGLEFDCVAFPQRRWKSKWAWGCYVAAWIAAYVMAARIGSVP